MAKFIILLGLLFVLVACERYRIVEMEDGSFRVQSRFALSWDDITDKYDFLPKERACALVAFLKDRDEKERIINKVKRVVECE